MNTWLNLPNALTLCRIGVIPMVFILWANDLTLTAALATCLAALTDFADGKLARATNQVTLFGAILDPVADKLMIMSLFGLLSYLGIIPVWLVLVTVLRNVSQLLSIPILMWWKKIRFNVRPAFIPKFASGLSFAIIVVGFAVSSAGSEALTSYGWLQGTLLAIFAVQGLIEVHILVTYWPRFLLIFNGKHDTFE